MAREALRKSPAAALPGALAAGLSKVLTLGLCAALLLAQQGPLAREAFAAAGLAAEAASSAGGLPGAQAGLAAGAAPVSVQAGVNPRTSRLDLAGSIQAGGGVRRGTVPSKSGPSDGLAAGLGLSPGAALNRAQAIPSGLGGGTASPALPSAKAQAAQGRREGQAWKTVPDMGPAAPVAGVSASRRSPQAGPEASDAAGQGRSKVAARLDAAASSLKRAALPGTPEEWDTILPAEPGAPKSLSEVSLEPPKDRTYMPSPEDWRDESIYMLMVDRFARGGEAKPAGDPKDGRSRHGGNIKGIIAQLDYIKGAGFSTLLLTPMALNSPGGYHGYWPIHLMAIDPHFGTMADFKRLVAEAHKRGMRVILDMVLNHTGPVFEYKDGSAWAGTNAPPKEVDWRYDFSPAELAKDEHFERRGVIGNWDDRDQVLHGDFPPNLRHYDAKNPKTQELLSRVAKWWIRETDVDGFRLDAYKHLDKAFWLVFHKSVRDYAAALGKRDFFLLGEISSGVDGEVAPAVNPQELDSAFNYPAFRNDDAPLHAEAPTKRLEEGWGRNLAAFGAAAGRLVRFLDNQDAFRFLKKRTPENLLRAALTYLFMAGGIPMLYYGTEQGLRHVDEGPHYDPGSRNDMFEGGRYNVPGQEGDMHRPDSPFYLLTRKLLGIRSGNPALRRGDQHVRWSDPDGPGIFAFSRIYEGQEAVVVLNTSGEARSAEMWVDANLSPAGTVFEDALSPGWSALAFKPEGGGSKVFVEVPANGMRILIRRTPPAARGERGPAGEGNGSPASQRGPPSA